uniref:Ovule protein n=1 Tax=Brugia timori TaxID=42155 RepID=A0A0R3Q471_9BILA
LRWFLFFNSETHSIKLFTSYTIFHAKRNNEIVFHCSILLCLLYSCHFSHLFFSIFIYIQILPNYNGIRREDSFNLRFILKKNEFFSRRRNLHMNVILFVCAKVIYFSVYVVVVCFSS